MGLFLPDLIQMTKVKKNKITQDIVILVVSQHQSMLIFLLHVILAHCKKKNLMQYNIV